MNMRWFLVTWLWFGTLLSFGAVSLAFGQEPLLPDNRKPEDETVQEQARALFEEGRRALHSERPQDAVAPLRRSLDLVRNAGTAFNLGVALSSADRFSEALVVFTDLLELKYGNLDPTQRTQVAQLQDQARESLATLELKTRIADSATVVVDRIHRGTMTNNRRLELRVDPGRHRVTAQFEGGGMSRREIEVRAGARRTVWLAPDPALQSTNKGRGPPAPNADAKADRPLRRSPWLWVGVAGVVIAAALSAGFLIRRSNVEALEDDVFGVTSTLRVP